MIGMSFSGKKIIIPLTLLVLLFFSSDPAYAQRSRRSAATPLRKTGAAVKTTESISAQTVAEIEARNKELIKQILDLQYERDFYKKKIAEWTESQKAVPKPIPAEKTAPEPKAPLYVPIPTGGYPAVAGWPGPTQGRETPADSLLNRLRMNLGRGQYDEALQVGEKLGSAPGGSDRHFFEYGSLLYKVGEFPQALEILSRVSQDDSLIASAAFYKGRIYQEQNSRMVAEVEFQRSRVLGLGKASQHVARGYQFLIGQQPDSAATAFHQALASQNRTLRAETFAGLAEVSFLKGDRTEEIRNLQQSLVYDPDYILTNYHLGVALFEAGEYQSALVFLKRVAQYSQNDLNIHLQLVKTYYRLRQWDAALSHCERIDRHQWPDDQEILIWLPKVYYVKSLLAKAEGDFYAATNYLRKAREVNPNASNWMQAALTDLAEIYQEGRDYNSALDFYIQKLRLDPADCQTLVKLGITYYQAGELTTAREILTKALNFPAVAGQAEIWLKQISLNAVN